MKKNIFVIIALLSSTIMASAQSEYADMRLGVGLRGGAAFPYVTKYNAFQNVVGGEGLLDVQYTMYWTSNTTNLGFLTGLSFGYQQTGLKEEINYYQYASSTDCGVIFYNNGAQNIEEQRQRLDLEIPFMLALKSEKGLFFNFGPRVAFPLWSCSKTTLASPTISANFVEEGVRIVNEPVTGVANQTSYNAQWNAPILTLKIGAEIGYEFMLKNNDAIGLGAYLDVAAYSAYKAKANTNLFQVTPPSNQAPASVVVNSPADKYAKQMGSVNLGIKLAYHFNMMK